jgi:hypothetical protein
MKLNAVLLSRHLKRYPSIAVEGLVLPRKYIARPTQSTRPEHTADIRQDHHTKMEHEKYAYVTFHAYLVTIDGVWIASLIY